MADITLVATPQGELRGSSQEDDRTFKRLKAWLKGNRSRGVTISYKRYRDIALHRRFMKMMRIAFDHWHPAKGAALEHEGEVIEKDFDQFRKDVLVMAGFYTPTYHLSGTVTLEAQSIAFDQMDQTQFDRVFEPVLNVLLQHILTNYTRADLERVVAELERFGQ